MYIIFPVRLHSREKDSSIAFAVATAAPSVQPPVFVFKMEEKSIQPLSEVGEDVIQELKKQHINQWMQDLTKRFEPVIQDQKFFVPANTGLLPVLPAK